MEWGLPGSSKNHQTFYKMVNTLFTLKSPFYFPFWTPFWLSRIRIRIRIPNTDPDPGEPFQYTSTWIRIRIRNIDFNINKLFLFFVITYRTASDQKKMAYRPVHWNLGQSKNVSRRVRCLQHALPVPPWPAVGPFSLQQARRDPVPVRDSKDVSFSDYYWPAGVTGYQQTPINVCPTLPVLRTSYEEDCKQFRILFKCYSKMLLGVATTHRTVIY